MTAAAASLTLADLDYELPGELIAQTPVEPRDSSRLLVVRRDSGELEDRAFADLPALLCAGDVLVRNDTRVFPARSFFRRATGGRIEALFLHALPEGDGHGERWEVLLRGRLRPGETLVGEAAPEWRVRCLEALGDGRWTLESLAGDPVLDLLARAGVTPLPPYIRAMLDDPERYQTTYAARVGSAAAPTAGLHFTPRLDAELAAAGVAVETVTLHVGLGTFKPLQEDSLEATTLHSEAFEVDAAVWARLCEVRRDHRRVIAVGTTSLRVLEHLALQDVPAGGATPLRGETRLFVRPGFRFRMADGLLTNFHLPRTSLLALVMAVCGAERTRAAYRHAITQRYRFYSFGDAMLAL